MVAENHETGIADDITDELGFVGDLLQVVTGVVGDAQLAAGAALGVAHLFHVARGDDHVTVEVLGRLQDQFGVDVGRVASALLHLVARGFARHEKVAFYFRFRLGVAVRQGDGHLLVARVDDQHPVGEQRVEVHFAHKVLGDLRLVARRRRTPDFRVEVDFFAFDALEVDVQRSGLTPVPTVGPPV